MDEFDVAIIGAGPGGYVCALRASDLGKSVALVEAREIGGTCLNRGCIPTKALLRSAEVYELARRSKDFGVLIESASYDLEMIHKRKEDVVNKLRSGIEFLLKKDVVIKKGFGKLANRKTVEIKSNSGNEMIKAKNIVIATGSEPDTLFNPDGKNVLTSDHALELGEIPKSLVIIGAGPIGVEFATLFSIFGTEVTMVEMMNKVLPALCAKDPKMDVIFRRSLRKRGIEVKTGTEIENIEVEGEKKVLSTLKGGETLESEKVLVSVGRKLNSSGLGLEEAGIKTEGGRILVDEKMRTNVPTIYAIGDVIGGAMLAHEAEKEGEVAAEVIAGLDTKMDYRVLPCAVFSHPEFACVGICEAEAQERGIETSIGESRFGANGKALCQGEEEGIVRIVVDAKTKEIVGSQIFGLEASVMISEIAVAMKKGVKVDDVADTIHVHPTLAEVLMEACKKV